MHVRQCIDIKMECRLSDFILFSFVFFWRSDSLFCSRLTATKSGTWKTNRLMLPRNLGHRIGASSVNDFAGLIMVGNESAVMIGARYTGYQIDVTLTCPRWLSIYFNYLQVLALFAEMYSLRFVYEENYIADGVDIHSLDKCF